MPHPPRSYRRTVVSLEGLIATLRTRSTTGIKRSEIVSGLEGPIQRLTAAGLIVPLGGGAIKPTLTFFTKDVESLRKTILGEE